MLSMCGRLRRRLVPAPSPLLTSRSNSSKTLSLHISDPRVLINNVASRYLSPSRIIIEFVDNSIDDMEASFDHEKNAYNRDVRINVHLNSKKNYVRIVDNANGMNSETLTRLVSNIGDSSKRDKTQVSQNVNGRFGFGMQSFRAAAHRLKIISCQEADSDVLHEMSFTREQAEDITPPYAISRCTYGTFPGNSCTGTDVTIEEWKDDWLTGYGGPKKLQEQLQTHFERLLHRENIHLCVIDDSKNGTIFKCSPFDYGSLLVHSKSCHEVENNDSKNKSITNITDKENSVVGETIHERFYLPGKKKQKEFIDVYFIILPKDSKNDDNRSVNIFCNGRRVSGIRFLKSFMRGSKNAWIWSHPNLIGFIDASCLTPVITRDEFNKNASRRKVYQLLYNLELELSTRLENHSNSYFHSDETYNKLEGVINNALSMVVREEKHDRYDMSKRVRVDDYYDGNFGVSVSEQEVPSLPGIEDKIGENVPEISTKSVTADQNSPHKRQADTSLARGVGLGVKFVKELDDNRRAKLVGNYIEIDVSHPDFESRVSTKSGSPRLTERLLGYISNVVSAAYQSSVHSAATAQSNDASSNGGDLLIGQLSLSDSDAVYDEMLNTIVESSTRLEAKLQKRLPALQKEIDRMTLNPDSGTGDKS